MEELWRRKLLCDVIIEVEKEHFHVHRSVLAATSVYFQTMFTEKWLENWDAIIKLKQTTKCGFREVLRFAYTGKAEISEENIKDVYMSANHYCYSALSELCVEFMLTTINTDNCLKYMRLAEVNGDKRLLDKVDNIVVNNLGTISKKTEFLELSKKALCRFIGCDEPQQKTKS